MLANFFCASGARGSWQKDNQQLNDACIQCKLSLPKDLRACHELKIQQYFSSHKSSPNDASRVCLCCQYTCLAACAQGPDLAKPAGSANGWLQHQHGGFFTLILQPNPPEFAEHRSQEVLLLYLLALQPLRFQLGQQSKSSGSCERVRLRSAKVPAARALGWLQKLLTGPSERCSGEQSSQQAAAESSKRTSF